MRQLEKAALFEALTEALDEIDSIFKEFGYNPEDFDEDAFDSGDVEDYDVAHAYSHVRSIKEIAEN